MCENEYKRVFVCFQDHYNHIYLIKKLFSTRYNAASWLFWQRCIKTSSRTMTFSNKWRINSNTSVIFTVSYCLCCSASPQSVKAQLKQSSRYQCTEITNMWIQILENNFTARGLVDTIYYAWLSMYSCRNRYSGAS